MFVGSLVGRVLGNLFLEFCIRVETHLKCLILFYLFFADKEKIIDRYMMTILCEAISNKYALMQHFLLLCMTYFQ